MSMVTANQTRSNVDEIQIIYLERVPHVEEFQI